MTRPRLLGQPGRWDIDPENPADELQFVYVGAMRIVRSRKRMRTLKRRGEDVIDTGERSRTGKRVYAWFVEAVA